jgi:hypothetical protein
VILLLLAIVPRLVEFLYVVGVNGNRLCAKSRMASLKRCSPRLTRGNDPEDRITSSLSLGLGEKSFARGSGLSRSLCQRSTEVSAFDEPFLESRVQNRDDAVVEDIQPGRWKVLLQKSRRKADRKSRTPRVLYFLQLSRERISAR